MLLTLSSPTARLLGSSVGRSASPLSMSNPHLRSREKALAQRALRKDPCSTLNKLSKLSVKQRKCSREGLGDASAASASSAAAAPGNHARLPSCPSEPGPRELPSAPATNGRSQRQRPARQDPRQTPIATRSAVAICRSMLRVKPQQTDAAYNQHSRRIMSIVA